MFKVFFFFPLFSRPMMYHGTKFDLIAIFCLHKRINISNFANEAQRNYKKKKNLWLNGLDLFFLTNISKYIRNQKLIFDLLAALSLLNMITSLYIELGVPKKKKKG